MIVMTKEIEPRPSTERTPHPADALPSIGEWYWYTENDEDKKPAPVCVTHVGSNYVGIKTPFDSFWRVHLDHFDDRCKPALDAHAHIARQIEEHRRRTAELIGEVEEITRRLSITAGAHALTPGNETQALALRGSGEDIASYKTALVKAKEKTLPDLFHQISAAGASSGAW